MRGRASSAIFSACRLPEVEYARRYETGETAWPRRIMRDRARWALSGSWHESVWLVPRQGLRKSSRAKRTSRQPSALSSSELLHWRRERLSIGYEEWVR